MREGETEKGGEERMGGERRGRTMVENTELHTKRGTCKLCCAALGSLVNLLFFSQLEVNRSVTDNRELLRWFI